MNDLLVKWLNSLTSAYAFCTKAHIPKFSNQPLYSNMRETDFSKPINSLQLCQNCKVI